MAGGTPVRSGMGFWRGGARGFGKNRERGSSSIYRGGQEARGRKGEGDRGRIRSAPAKKEREEERKEKGDGVARADGGAGLSAREERRQGERAADPNQIGSGEEILGRLLFHLGFDTIPLKQFFPIFQKQAGKQIKGKSR